MSIANDRAIIAEWTGGLRAEAATKAAIKQINNAVPRETRCVFRRPDAGYVAWLTGPEEAMELYLLDVGYPRDDAEWGIGWEIWSRRARGPREFLCAGWQGDGSIPHGTHDNSLWVAVFPTEFDAECAADGLVGKAGVYAPGPWTMHVAPVGRVRPSGFAGYFLVPRTLL